MADYTYANGKLKRSHLLHFLDSSFGGSGTPGWAVQGKDVDDMSVELNPDTETVKNVLDESSVNDNGYEPGLDVGTYYADPGNPMYDKLKDIALNRLTGDSCKTTILEVVVDKTTGPYDAWQEDCIVKPQSYGGPQGGVNIPYNINFAGNRIKGTVTFTSGAPTFTAANAE